MAAMSLAGGCLLMILPAARGNKSFLKGEPERHIQHSSHEETEAGSGDVTCQGWSWEGAALDTCSQRELEPECGPILNPGCLFHSIPGSLTQANCSLLYSATCLFIGLQLNFFSLNNVLSADHMPCVLLISILLTK